MNEDFVNSKILKFHEIANESAYGNFVNQLFRGFLFKVDIFFIKVYSSELSKFSLMFFKLVKWVL